MLGWDRNPLRRRVDQVKAAMVVGLIAVFLISAPVLAAVAGHWIGSAGIQEHRAEAGWRLVPVTVLGSVRWDNSAAAAGTVWIPAHWTRRMGGRAAAGSRLAEETRQAASSGCGSPGRAR